MAEAVSGRPQRHSKCFEVVDSREDGGWKGNPLALMPSSGPVDMAGRTPFSVITAQERYCSLPVWICALEHFSCSNPSLAVAPTSSARVNAAYS